VSHNCSLTAIFSLYVPARPRQKSHSTLGWTSRAFMLGHQRHHWPASWLRTTVSWSMPWNNVVVQHGWQSRALGSHPQGHSALTTPGQSSLHGIETRTIAQSCVGATERVLALCSQGFFCGRRSVSRPFIRVQRPRVISTRPS
jgi:hypothetical protein